MIAAEKEELIYGLSLGNLQVLQFSTADEVEAKVEEIRSYLPETKEPWLTSDCFWSCPASDRFWEVYNIEPWVLMDILGN